MHAYVVPHCTYDHMSTVSRCPWLWRLKVCKWWETKRHSFSNYCDWMHDMLQFKGSIDTKLKFNMKWELYVINILWNSRNWSHILLNAYWCCLHSRSKLVDGWKHPFSWNTTAGKKIHTVNIVYALQFRLYKHKNIKYTQKVRNSTTYIHKTWIWLCTYTFLAYIFKECDLVYIKKKHDYFLEAQHMTVVNIAC